MKLEIISGIEFNADFTVISSDGVTGEVLSVGDTGTISLSTTGITPACVLGPIDLTITDADNGLFSVILTAEQTVLLEQEVGFAEDNYPTISGYKALLDFILVSGNRSAIVDVYVRKVGTCPVTP